jgi:hypothetical protein
MKSEHFYHQAEQLQFIVIGSYHSRASCLISWAPAGADAKRETIPDILNNVLKFGNWNIVPGYKNRDIQMKITVFWYMGQAVW